METGKAEATNCRVKDEGDDVMQATAEVSVLYVRYMYVTLSKMRIVGYDRKVPWCRRRGADINLSSINGDAN